MFIILYWCYWPSVVYSRLEMLQSLSWEFTMMVVGSQYTKEYQLCGKYVAGGDWLIAANFTGRTYVSISETVRWSWWLLYHHWRFWRLLDSIVHGANMGPIWGRQDPGGHHVGPMNLAIWAVTIFDILSDDKAVIETAFSDSIAVLRVVNWYRSWLLYITAGVPFTNMV